MIFSAFIGSEYTKAARQPSLPDMPRSPKGSEGESKAEGMNSAGGERENQSDLTAGAAGCTKETQMRSQDSESKNTFLVSISRPEV